MRIEFTGRRTEVPEPLRKLGERKLQKLARVLPGITRAHVILSVDRHRQVVEVNVRSPRLDLAAQESTGDFGASIAAAFDKVTRQAQLHVGKRLASKRRGQGLAAAVPSRRRGDAPAGAPGQAAASPRRALRVSRVKVVPMTADEAALTLAQQDEAFVLFRDPITSRLRVLHRRKDGLLGLLEPEV
jgi:putative sigma-54 modulation protein